MVSTKPIEYTNPLGSYQSTFEIGAPNGIVLTVDVTATPYISFTDKSGAFTIVKGADPVVDDDLATKRYADSLIATPQYWDRAGADLIPLNVGDNIVVDPTLLGTPYIDSPNYIHSGNVIIEANNAVADSSVSINNNGGGGFFVNLLVNGRILGDYFNGYTDPGIARFCVSGAGDGLTIDSASMPGTVGIVPIGAVTGCQFLTNVATLNLNVADILNITPSVAGLSSLGDVIIDSGAGNTLAYSDGAGGWLYPITGPSGLNAEIQFNDAGALGSDPLFVYDRAINHLGIGVNTPLAEIHVETGPDAGLIYFTNTANAVGGALGLSAAGVLAIEQYGAFDFGVRVNGNLLIQGFSTGEVVVGSGGTAASPTKGFYVDTTDGMHLHPCALPAGNAGDICIDSGAANALKYHNGVGWVTPGVTIGGGDTHVQYNDSGSLAGTDALVWNYVNGRLGINVPLGNPQSGLHIDGAAGAAVIKLSNDVTGRSISDGLNLSLSATGNGILSMLANKDLQFATNATTIVTIKNDGKIGFGIATPATNFHFDVGTGNSGGIQITNNATSGVTSSDGVGIFISSGKTLLIFNLESTWNSFVFGSTPSDEKVRIYDTGKTIISDDISGVTVGATQEVLWLDDSGRNSTCIHFTNGDTGHNSASDGLVFGLRNSRGGDAWINQREAKDLEIWTSNTKRAVFAANGAVGINSATPVSFLDVNGSLGCGYYETAVDLLIAAADPYHTIVVTADAKTVTLPPAADVPRRIFVIKAMIAGAGPTSVTVEGNGVEIFDKIAGLLNLTLVGTTAGAAVQNEAVTVQSNGVGWTVISRTVDCHPGL